MELVLAVIVAALLIAWGAYKSPIVKHHVQKVFGTRTTDKSANVGKKIDEFFKK